MPAEADTGAMTSIDEFDYNLLRLSNHSRGDVFARLTASNGTLVMLRHRRNHARAVRQVRRRLHASISTCKYRERWSSVGQTPHADPKKCCLACA